MKMRCWAFALVVLFSLLAILEKGSAQEQCGWQAGGALCPQGLCCSHWGFCGSTEPYCGGGCQSQCPTPPPPPSPPPPPPPSPPPPSPPPPPPPSPPPPSPPPPTVQCGSEAGGALCPQGFCCSKWGFCGTTEAYCGPDGCQSQCPTPPPPLAPAPSAPTPPLPPPAVLPPAILPPVILPPPPPPPSPPSTTPPPSPTPSGGEDISDLITRPIFEEIISHNFTISPQDCPAYHFYSYDAFITATKSFSAFATTGDTDKRKREIAAFLSQVAILTGVIWPPAASVVGFCWNHVGSSLDAFCVPNEQWPCVPGKKYYYRGPFRLAYNYNYGPAGEAIGVELLNNPDLVEIDPTIQLGAALWFWMNPQSPSQPSCHDVITGSWTPSAADLAAGRVPGYGATSNIIYGGSQCGLGRPTFVGDNRIMLYSRYCEMLGVSPGDNLDCENQAPFENYEQLLLDNHLENYEQLLLDA